MERREKETSVLRRILPATVPFRARPADEEPMPKALPIPGSHLDLLIGAYRGVLTALMRDGQPRSRLVWCDHDGECALVNTTLDGQKARNLRRDPRGSLLIVDPTDTARCIEIRGRAEFLTQGALEHINRITRTNTHYTQYYGYVLPLERKARDTRILCGIRATQTTLDAIHGEKSSS